MIPNASLWVPLPLPLEDYLEDFDSQVSKEEFMMLFGKAERVIPLPPADSRELAYLAAGRYILENSDVLISIWDGNSSRGTAGTGDLITIAREHSLPLAWIHTSDHSKSPGHIATENTAQGEVSFEHFPAPGKNL